MVVQEKNLATCIILTIVTCGIYGIVWFVNMTNDVAKVSGDHSISGGTAFLLTIVTCGIYGLYWGYKMGKLLSQAKANRGMIATDNSVLYLFLEWFISIVAYALIQNELNEIVRFSSENKTQMGNA